ncbi:hypothetical protein SAMN04489859_1006150 [Paracoccus alcaliphilus]|uniref:Uncharacterized protein n=1 Tax=Paracoccus alcaliphilus TaxID=34002 RepID=A0A1H8GE33_9RHOB|nr:hypothetical protein [Paracoccus alcaliphilus]SEN42421.1 hypothetical protein SAMN04489859_1006150 [Paracoccus alcaliphilus]
MIVMRCNGCRRQVNYWASDLVKVAPNPDHQAHIPLWPCSRCRTKEYMVMRWHYPMAAELVEGLTVRRPVRKVERWIWRDEKA